MSQLESQPKREISQDYDPKTKPKKKAPAKSKVPAKEINAKEQNIKEAPKKKNQKQAHIKEDADTLLDYFKSQNRPFTQNFLKDSLCLKLAPLQKNLETLVSRGDITVKDVGSTKVYLVNQDLQPKVNQAELDSLNTELECSLEEYKKVSQIVSKGQEQLKIITKVPKLEDLSVEVEEQKTKVNTLKSQLLEMEKQPKASDQETFETEKAHQEMALICRKRKKMYMEAVGMILQESEMTLAQFEAMIGIKK